MKSLKKQVIKQVKNLCIKQVNYNDRIGFQVRDTVWWHIWRKTNDEINDDIKEQVFFWIWRQQRNRL